jgi:sensor histidine kinase YesM
MKSEKRRRLLVNRPVQVDLIRRAVIYWMLCMLVVTYMAVCWLVLPKDPSSFGEFVMMTYDVLGPVLTTSVFVVPLIILDCIRMSNRFAGPVNRLHREIKQIANGQEAARIRLRKGDHWHEVADDFNRMLERIKKEEWCLQAKGDEDVKANSCPVDAELHSITS